MLLALKLFSGPLLLVIYISCYFYYLLNVTRRVANDSLKKELANTETYLQTSKDEKSFVDDHRMQSVKVFNKYEREP